MRRRGRAPSRRRDGRIPRKNRCVACDLRERETPKIGRNDLCPCGSGEKFKKDAPVRPKVRRWGGKREGAGRPRKPERQRTFVGHVARPVHKKRHPVHVTLRARGGLPYFRRQSVQAMLERVLARQQFRAYSGSFQVAHFSIQSNHLHLLVEATDKRAMRSGVSGLVIAFAKKLNALLGRSTGKVWGERYHARDLETPAEVRNALVYVLQNFKKHGTVTHGGPIVDHHSSAPELDGWRGPVVSLSDGRARWKPRRPRTWLLDEGWRIHGLLHPAELPATAGAGDNRVRR
jgi:REP element-mobilizing transposase RayT